MTLVVVTHETRLSQAAGRVVTLSDHRLRPVDTAAAPRQAT